MNWLYAAAYGIDCKSIGCDSAKTPTIDAAFTNATQLIIGVIGSLAIIFIIYAGVQFALSGGNPKTVQTAKQTLTYAVIGLVLSLAAYAIVAFITQIK